MRRIDVLRTFKTKQFPTPVYISINLLTIGCNQLISFLTSSVKRNLHQSNFKRNRPLM